MTYFRENFHDNIISIWKSHYYSAPPEIKILLIYVANEAIVQSSRKGKMEYTKGFGDIFVDAFKDMTQ
jgi:hypothetical protein